MGPKGFPGKNGISVCSSGNTAGQGMCCGSVPAKLWTQKTAYSLAAPIDMGKCRFSEAPTVFTSLMTKAHGKGSMNSQSNIINNAAPGKLDAARATALVRTEFEIDSATVAKIKDSWAWELKWCAFGNSVASKGKTRPTYETCCGSSNSAWKSKWGSLGLQVDTSGCGWKDSLTGSRPPYYFMSLSDNACGTELSKGTPRCAARSIGWQSTYGANAKGFTVYARALPGFKLPSEADAKTYNWQIKWCGVKEFHPRRDSVAGYPCTATRLLKGGGSQTTFTDFGSICCDTTASDGWKAAGSDSVTKTIDISPCKFDKVQYLFTNVRGDAPSIDSAVGASSYASTGTKNKYRVYVYTAGRYKFYNAAQHNWKVQWCAYGR